MGSVSIGIPQEAFERMAGGGKAKKETPENLRNLARGAVRSYEELKNGGKKMINRIVAAGRLTADAKLKYTPNGAAVAEFSICVNDSYKKNGEWVDKPYFFNCSVWGKYAEAMAKHLTKGRFIGVEGKLVHNPWTDGSGSKHNDCAIAADNIHLFPKPGGGSEKHPPPGEETAGNGPVYDDKIPF